MRPSGSKDPFALRRAAIGILDIVLTSNLRLKVQRALSAASLPILTNVDGEGDSVAFVDVEKKLRLGAKMRAEVLDFFADRLKVQQREAGVRHDLIDAVFALGGEDDLVRLLARVRALQAFVGTEDGANLLAGYKRAANILKKEGWDAAGSSRHQGGGVVGYTPEPAEAALIAALGEAEPAAEAAVAAEDFAGAMTALASLRAPVDAFFDAVTVNDPDPVKRETRLNLLLRIRNAVHRVADFSKIEG